jgi:hypothetical protein
VYPQIRPIEANAKEKMTHGAMTQVLAHGHYFTQAPEMTNGQIPGRRVSVGRCCVSYVRAKPSRPGPSVGLKIDMGRRGSEGGNAESISGGVAGAQPPATSWNPSRVRVLAHGHCLEEHGGHLGSTRPNSGYLALSRVKKVLRVACVGGSGRLRTVEQREEWAGRGVGEKEECRRGGESNTCLGLPDVGDGYRELTWVNDSQNNVGGREGGGRESFVDRWGTYPYFLPVNTVRMPRIYCSGIFIAVVRRTKMGTIVPRV